MADRLPCVYIVEDDPRLISEAQVSGHGRYEVIGVPVSQSNDPTYWQALDLQAGDTLVIDLNLRADHSGYDVLSLLEREKAARRLGGLENVLVATSLREQVELKKVDPRIGLLRGFRVYGLEKGTDVRRNVDVQRYGTSLLDMIDRIYCGEEAPLNE